ncbi:MAG TPA: LysR substrate-binding domain-containing protein [Rhizomicrobium sp.]|nr:LysR substrate-binding domain-containing protein [Rhizomicrobium sp.]
MELMQLQMFVAAAEAHSLQRAAERVRRTPQAVSMAIGKLEDEIGVLLFDRGARGFRLTSAGEVFLGHAKRALNVLNEALAAIKDIRGAQKGHLRIGANQSIGEYILPQLTQSFRERYPGVTLRIVIGYSEAILSALENGDVDVALVAEKPKDRQLQVQLLMTDRLVAILNPRHSLAAREAVTLRELAAESLILLTETSELRERVVETFRRAGIALDPCVETGTLDSVKRMAARDMGIGIVPLLSVTAEESDRLVARTIDAFQQDRPLWIVQPENPSPASQAFVALLKAQIGTAG